MQQPIIFHSQRPLTEHAECPLRRACTANGSFGGSYQANLLLAQPPPSFFGMKAPLFSSTDVRALHGVDLPVATPYTLQ